MLAGTDYMGWRIHRKDISQADETATTWMVTRRLAGDPWLEKHPIAAGLTLEQAAALIDSLPDRTEGPSPRRLTCRTCGGCDLLGWNEKTCERLILLGVCSNCEFWVGYATRRSDGRAVIVDGQHYMLGDEKSRSYFRGFGGNKFTIRFHDGHMAVSTNLWFQGVVPERWRPQLPDNAVFVREKRGRGAAFTGADPQIGPA